MHELDDRLVGIIEDLVVSLEMRDAAEPDSPAWEADARIRRLEAELVERYRAVEHPALGRSLDVAMAGVF